MVQESLVLVQFGEKNACWEKMPQMDVMSDGAEVTLRHRFTEILAHPSLKSKIVSSLFGARPDQLESFKKRRGGVSGQCDKNRKLPRVWQQ